MLGLVFTDPSGNRILDIPGVDKPLTVGRATDVDVHLPYKAISRYHARFFMHGDQLYVEDLGSSNGVLLAGYKISGPTAINSGDHIRIGVIDVIVSGGAPAFAEQAPYAGGLDAPGTEAAPPPAEMDQGQPWAPAAPPAPDNPFADPMASGSPMDPYASAQPPAADPYASAQPPAADPYVGAQPTDSAEPPTLPDSGPQIPQPEVPGKLVAVDPSVAPGAEGVAPEVEPEAPTMALPNQPRLVGKEGVFKDKVTYLDQDEVLVGRVKACALFVEDASVSRQHAKIIRKEEELTLFDLRSFNGTFVNDEKVTRQILEEGDVVRFGDIPFDFLLRQEPADAGKKKTKKKLEKRQRLIILATVGIVLLTLVVAGNLLFPDEPPPPPPDPLAEQRALEAKIRQQVERGAAELRRREWDAATTTLQEVLKLDPLNQDAVAGLDRARKEKERKSWMDEAVRVAEAGRDMDRAKTLLTKIPERSSYFPDARLRLRRINRTIATEARNLGLTNCRAWRYEECQRLLCKFFQAWPRGEPIPDEVRARRALERAESRLKRRRGFEPCKIPEPGTGDEATDEALAKRYPEERIRTAVFAFYRGKAENGVRMLEKLSKRRSYAEHRETISKLVESMIRVQSASADVYRDIRGANLSGAEVSYRAMQQSESVVMPRGTYSHYMREAKKLFGKAYHELGQEHLSSGRMQEAFESWSKGKAHAPTNPEILRSLMALESKARTACQQAREWVQAGDRVSAVRQFELCRNLTTKSSKLHQEAVEGLRQLGQ